MDASTSNILIALFASTLIFLLLGGFAVAFTIIYKKKQQKNKEETTKRELNFQNELLLTQVEIQEKTLETISQEIHDNIGQVLTAALLTLRIIKTEDPKIKNELALVNTLMSDALKDLRNLSQSFNTEKILEKGLLEAIEFEFTILKRTGINTNFEVLGNYPSILPQNELILFRIIQESLSNIIKHAQAKNITIRAICNEEHLALEIIDDGVGFNTNDKSKGIGLKNILNRSKLIGANTQIISAPNEGTKTILSINTI